MSDRVKNTLFGEARILLIAFGAGLMFTIVFAIVTRLYAADAHGEIAGSILRFHVLANSDTESDQALKLLVRDAVLASYADLLGNAQNRQESIATIRDELANIRDIAALAIAEAGYDYPVEAMLSSQFFPTRIYGELRLPPGMYDALTIRIGDAIGENWWCVLFPPLCVVEEAQANVTPQGRERFAEVISPSAYDLMSYTEPSNRVQVRFAVVEWWQSRYADRPDEEVLFVQN